MPAKANAKERGLRRLREGGTLLVSNERAGDAQDDGEVVIIGPNAADKQLKYM